jgi:hypothetical protein
LGALENRYFESADDEPDQFRNENPLPHFQLLASVASTDHRRQRIAMNQWTRNGKFFRTDAVLLSRMGSTSMLKNSFFVGPNGSWKST